MNLKLLKQNETLEIIKDREFVSKWKAIANNSEEFTLIQEPDLVISWYEAYESHYTPVMVVAYDNKMGEVIGILPLAHSIEEGILSHAAAEQAEYNGWVCLKDYEEDFLIESLVLLRDEFDLTKWDWGWMPPQANTEWLNSEKLKAHGIHVNVNTCESPIYDLQDKERIAKIKKSKSTKSKINRLKRSGELKMERITELSRAKEVFPELKKISNFRNLAVYDNMPFSTDDSCKEKWHLNHLDGSQSVHFTVLWQGDELLASNFGFCSEDTVIIGLFTYNPVQGSHSPGNVFLIELLDFIEQEGFRYLDLSPGGDPYKERFSNRHNTLTKPVFSFNSTAKLKNNVMTFIKNKVKEKYSYRDIVNFKSRAERKLSEVTHAFEENTLFHFSNEEKNISKSNLFKQQKYDDLLLYHSKKGKKKHSEFIFSALKNFERGDVLYSRVENNVLVFSAWVSCSAKKHWNKKIDELTSSVENAVLIYDVYSEAGSINPVLINEFSSAVFVQHINGSTLNDLYLVKPKGISEKQIQKAGFNLAKSVSS